MNDLEFKAPEICGVNELKFMVDRPADGTIRLEKDFMDQPINTPDTFLNEMIRNVYTRALLYNDITEIVLEKQRKANQDVSKDIKIDVFKQGVVVELKTFTLGSHAVVPTLYKYRLTETGYERVNSFYGSFDEADHGGMEDVIYEITRSLWYWFLFDEEFYAVKSLTFWPE